MENLNRDELFKIAVLLDLPDLLSFCNSSFRINNLICKRKDIWLYKLRNEFPNFEKFLKNHKSLKGLYEDMAKYSIPKKFDSEKTYDIFELYKAVEKEYNTREEFEKFVRKIDIYHLIVKKRKDWKLTVNDYLDDVEDSVGARALFGGIRIYFSYPDKKVDYGYPADRTNTFIIWSK